MDLIVTKEQWDSLDPILQKQYNLNAETGQYELQLNDAGVKKALDAERKNAKSSKQLASQLQQQIDQFRGLGKSPEEIQALIDQQVEAERKALEEKGQYEQLRTQQVEAHKKELASRELVAEKLRAELRKEKVNTLAAIACAKAKVPAGPIMDRLERVAEMDAKTLQVTLKDNDGNVISSLREGQSGTPMGVEEFVLEYLPTNPDYQALYPAEAIGGSGTPPAKNSAKGSTSGSKIISRGDLMGHGIDPAEILKGNVTVSE